MPAKTKAARGPVMDQVTLETPLGPVILAFSEAGLKKLQFVGDQIRTAAAAPAAPPKNAALIKKWRRIIKALEDYFGGKPAAFENLPLDLEGSPYHLRVWQELQKIPAGETISYQEMARRLGNPNASRAVGQACGANPIPLIVPCHRVIAKSGALGGFSSGLKRKRWLLDHERRQQGVVSKK